MRCCLMWLLLNFAGCAFMRPSQAPASDELRTYRAYWLEINAPADLLEPLKKQLDVARYQFVPEGDEITQFELSRLAAASPSQARSILEAQGHFNAEVKVTQEADIEGRPSWRLSVNPGPRATIDQSDIRIIGPLKDQAERGEAPAAELEKLLLATPGLLSGRAFSAASWSSAKAEIETQAHLRGYPLASLIEHEATVDVAENKVRISVVLDSGPQAVLGALQIEGLRYFDEGVIRPLSTFKPGTPYQDRLLTEFADRLRRLGLFDSVAVSLDTHPDTLGAAPVRVKVRENARQQANIGIGYSDRAGESLMLEHLHRSVFDSRWVSRNKMELARERQQLDSSLTSHPQANGDRWFTTASLSRDTTNAISEVRSMLINAGVTSETNRIERRIFGEWVNSETRFPSSPQDNSRNSAYTGNYEWIWRDLDSLLLPTRGLSANLRASAGYAVEDKAPFQRTYARLTYYMPLGQKWHSISRLEAGSVFTRPGVGVPQALLFHAGGSGSVRGYADKSLGPTPEEAALGGLSVATGSLEIARPFLESHPSVWGAAFIDGGSTAARWTEIRPAWGYGVGVRWRGPIGPVSLDLAYGRVNDKLQLRTHFSFGVVF
jgi:translocation and assembly module TamA